MSDPRAERLKRFRLHALVFVGLLFVAIGVNAIAMPSYPWWMWLGTVWALPLAVHWAYAHEMIGRRR